MISHFALIIGAMKCGTTSLFSHLAQHPQISPCSPKEPEFFSNNENWARGLDWYQSLWKWRPGIHTCALEASTNYTKVPHLPNAAERIATVKADFRFIYIMRNPVERIESHYRHQIVKSGAHGRKNRNDEVSPALIAVSKYAMQIDEYARRFPRDRILLLRFEDLKSDPGGMLDTVCRFLQLDAAHEFKGLGIAHNQSTTDHPFYRFLTQSPVVPALAKLIPQRHKQAFRNFLARKVDANTELTAQQRAFVERELKEDLRRLREEYGFETSRWRIEPVSS